MATAVFWVHFDLVDEFEPLFSFLEGMPPGSFSRIEIGGVFGRREQSVRVDAGADAIRALTGFLACEPKLVALTVCEACLEQEGDEIVHGLIDATPVSAAICRPCLLVGKREAALTWTSPRR